jgi:hypothetical protein
VPLSRKSSRIEQSKRGGHGRHQRQELLWTKEVEGDAACEASGRENEEQAT